MDQKYIVAAGGIFLAGIVYHYIQMLRWHFRFRNMEKRLREEQSASLQALARVQEIEVLDNKRLAEENAHLREQVLNQQTTILALRNDTAKQEKLELKNLRETLEKMHVAIPGFSAVWIPAYNEICAKNEKEATTGLKAFFRKWLPALKSSPAAVIADPEKKAEK